MRKKGFLRSIWLILCFLFCFFTTPTAKAIVADTTDYYLDINFSDNLELTDNGILLFHAKNVAPGDYFITNITVSNFTDFDVDFFIDDIVVDNPLFEGVMVYQITENDNIIYNADRDFAKKIAVFSPGEVKKFVLKSMMKSETENDIQGESAWFSFVFRVYMDEENILVPDTGNNFISLITSRETHIILYIIIIAAIIIFVLYQCLSRKNDVKTKKKKGKKTKTGKKKQLTKRKNSSKNKKRTKK